MSSVHLHIETEGKGRSFSALVLARVYAPVAWAAGATERNTHRPALMLLATPHDEASPVAANLREGRKMKLRGPGFSSKGEKCEVLRGEHFSIGQQRTEEGTLLLVRHPEIFSFVGSGVVDEHVRFVCLPPRARLQQEAPSFDAARTQTHLRRLGFMSWSEEAERERPNARLVRGLADPLFPAFAALLVAGVAQRMSFPVPNDPLFWAQFSAALLADGLARRSREERCYSPEIESYAEVGVVESGFYPGAAVSASQGQIGEVLSRETRAFLKR